MPKKTKNTEKQHKNIQKLGSTFELLLNWSQKGPNGRKVQPTGGGEGERGRGGGGRGGGRGGDSWGTGSLTLLFISTLSCTPALLFLFVDGFVFYHVVEAAHSVDKKKASSVARRKDHGFSVVRVD